jgi:hypothetical protein
VVTLALLRAAAVQSRGRAGPERAPAQVRVEAAAIMGPAPAAHGLAVVRGAPAPGEVEMTPGPQVVALAEAASRAAQRGTTVVGRMVAEPVVAPAVDRVAAPVSAGPMAPEEHAGQAGVPEERAAGRGPARREPVGAAVGGMVGLAGAEWGRAGVVAAALVLVAPGTSVAVAGRGTQAPECR